MTSRTSLALGLAAMLAAPSLALAKEAPKPPRLDAAAINGADLAEGAKAPEAKGRGMARGKAKEASAVLLKAQVLLDRARFSPGAIDGRDGDNFRNALTAFAGNGDVTQTASVDAKAGTAPAVWQRLAATSADPVVKEYTITKEDADGPYVATMPPKMEEQAELEAMGYTSPVEMLAERFHMSQALLRALNPGKDFGRAGETIVVAAVTPMVLPEKPGLAGKPSDPVVTRLVVDKSRLRVQAFDAEGRTVGVYPASVGSTEKPAPSGTFEVKRVALDPNYTYNPKYAFKGVKAKEKFTIHPGPNNPVGLVWIDLSAKSYGIHGTPEPEKVGKTESHGCIRLTNWDVLTLAAHVRKGAEVVMEE